VIPSRVSLRAVVHVLLGRWIVITAFAVFFGAASVLYALTRTPLYESNALLAPVKEDAGQIGALSSVLGQFAGVAGGLGISVGGASEDEAVAVLESREFSLRFMREHGVLPIMYPQLWDTARQMWKPAEPGRTSGPSLDNAVKAFDDFRVAVVDRRTEFVRLSVRAPTPLLAEDWAAAMIHELNEVLRQRSLEESQKAVDILSKAVETAQIQSIRVAAASLLESQLRRQVLAQSRRDYAMRILDPPSVPDQRYYPKRTRMVIVGTGTGFLLGSLFVLSLRAWRRTN
jgi:hypothetical protein